MIAESKFISIINEVNAAYGKPSVESKEVNALPESSSPDFTIIFRLVYSYELDNIPPGLLVFDSEILENAEFLLFGRNVNHSFDYAIHKESGVIVGLETGHLPSYRCARSCESFINAMTELLSLELRYASQGSVSEEVRLGFKQRCIALAGGNEYSRYYELVI